MSTKRTRTLWMTALGLSLVACAWLPSRADAQPPQPRDDESLDDRLRKELEADPLDDFPPEPSGRDERQETPGTSSDGPDEDLKERLQRELGAAAVPEDDNVHPLLAVARRMRQVEKLIGGYDSGSATQQLQNQIVADLDRLLKQTRKRAEQNKQNGSAAQQMATRGPVAQPQLKQPGGENPNGKPATATPPSGNDQTAARKPDMNQMRQVISQLLLELPRGNRQQVQQSWGEEFLPKYELLIEEYYRRLSEKRGR